MKLPYFLYAEDDQDDVDILNEVLATHRGRVGLVSVNDGFQLLKYLQEVPRNKAFPDLIILDMNLPRLSGLQTLKLLRTDDLYRLIPAVILSTRSSAAEKAECSALGADTFLKPSGFRDWQGIISHLCGYLET